MWVITTGIEHFLGNREHLGVNGSALGLRLSLLNAPNISQFRQNRRKANISIAWCHTDTRARNTVDFLTRSDIVWATPHSGLWKFWTWGYSTSTIKTVISNPFIPRAPSARTVALCAMAATGLAGHFPQDPSTRAGGHLNSTSLQKGWGCKAFKEYSLYKRERRLVKQPAHQNRKRNGILLSLA